MRPATSILERTAASATQPGATSRSGQTTTTANGGNSHASANAAASATLARRARRARGLIGCGSYDAVPYWPPMPRVSERARPIWLAAAACAAGFLLVALLVISGITDPIDAAITAVVRAPELHDALAPLARVTELGSTWAIIGVGALVLAGWVGWAAGHAMGQPVR